MQQRSYSAGSIIENGIDVILNFASILMAYVVTMAVFVLYDSEFQPAAITPDSMRTLTTVFFIVLIQSFAFRAFHLYRPLPYLRIYRVLTDIVKVNVPVYCFGALLTMLIFDFEDARFGVFWMVCSLVVSTAVLLFKKRMMIRFAKFFRRNRYNLRKVIIIGDNTAAASEFLLHVNEDEAGGMMVIGYVGDKIDSGIGVSKLGSFNDLGQILDEYKPSDVVFAIDSYNKKKLIKMVNLCDDRCIKVYFLPVIYGFFKSSRQIEPVGSLPVINIHSTPLDSRLNAFMKRAVDMIGSLALLIVTSPIMLFAAIGVYITSPGPVLFRQERVGKMGKTFTMLKFRSMKVNVSEQTGWSNKNDTRKTKFGAFLRRTSIDELPQLINVLRGDMSLVGPRPEVPHFVDKFREEIPLYMVKHYVKPGLTGLAQVSGLRGDTSVEERIKADIEYIENWSLGMDIYILLKTPFKAFNKDEQFVPEAEADGKKEAVAEMSTENADNANNADKTINEHGTDEGVRKINGCTELGEAVAELADENCCESGDNSKKKKKILYAASVMTHINNFHMQYIAKLREDGYDVRVMARGEGADYNVPFDKKMLSSSNTACRAEIRRIIERERFDVIILNTSLAAFHIRLCLPKQDRPRVVNIVHGYLFSEHTGFLKRRVLLAAERLVAKKTDAIIVMNEDDRRIAERYKLCLGKVYVSRGMGASVKPQVTPCDSIRQELGCKDKYVLAFVGELSGRKNQAFLINAMNSIKNRIPNAVLWLVGDGKERESLMELAQRVDLTSSVFFLGQRKDACDVMRACDLYVSASSIEGMPFNIIEAMGCGKCVLASDIKGHRDIINDGKGGFLFEFGSMRKFVDKVAAIHDGRLTVDTASVIEQYRRFANDNVFRETYDIIRDSFGELDEVDEADENGEENKSDEKSV